VYLEIFSGSGRLSTAFGRANELVLKWDVLLGPAYDLTKRQGTLLIVGWIRAGLIRGVHMGTPYTSFSRVRGVGIGPPAVRSVSEPMGLASLSRDADINVVALGNTLLKVSIHIFNVCLIFKVPASLENPATSLLWLTPGIVHLSHQRTVSLVTTEFCMWGTPWRKSTSFLHAGLDLSVVGDRRCLNAPRGFCRRTLIPHMCLRGRAPNGSWWTNIGEPYPPKLCHALVEAFCNSHLASRAKCFKCLIEGNVH
jgi:hypothetical protein